LAFETLNKLESIQGKSKIEEEDFSFLADLPKQSTLLPELLFKTTENIIKPVWKTHTASKSCMHENRGTFCGETETTKKQKRKRKKNAQKLKEDLLTVKNSDSSLISIEEFDIWKFI